MGIRLFEEMAVDNKKGLYQAVQPLLPLIRSALLRTDRLFFYLGNCLCHRRQAEDDNSCDCLRYDVSRIITECVEKRIHAFRCISCKEYVAG